MLILSEISQKKNDKCWVTSLTQLWHMEKTKLLNNDKILALDYKIDCPPHKKVRRYVGK